MREEYLWDKSGEPDPEIQQLEQILGTLRYQPKSLNLPEDVQPVRRNNHLSLVAIAATLLVALLAGGLWLIVNNKPEPQPIAIAVPQAAPLPTPSVSGATPERTEVKVSTVEPTRPEKNKLASNVKHSTRPSTPRFTKQEREEAMEVKQQLMVALRVASEKLNLAHRKAQGASPTQIRNQHKVG